MVSILCSFSMHLVVGGCALLKTSENTIDFPLPYFTSSKFLCSINKKTMRFGASQSHLQWLVIRLYYVYSARNIWIKFLASMHNCQDLLLNLRIILLRFCECSRYMHHWLSFLQKYTSQPCTGGITLHNRWFLCELMLSLSAIFCSICQCPFVSLFNKL